MVFRAKLRRLEFETKQARLIEAEAVRKTVAEAVRTIRDGILGLPDRLATVLAAESDPKKVHVTLRTELSRELEGLAHAIGSI
jgi:membrane carboxypeptidase/penicillin-binding protein PbpC